MKFIINFLFFSVLRDRLNAELWRERLKSLENLEFQPKIESFSSKTITSLIYPKNRAYNKRIIKLIHEGFNIKPIEKIENDGYFAQLEKIKAAVRKDKK